jgi:Tfp pilus assembly protein PilP
MKLRTGILVLGMTVGAAWAQNPDVIQDTRSILQNVQKKQTIDQNAALAASGQATPKAAPASQPAPAVKPAPSKPASTSPAATGPQSKPGPVPAPKVPASAPANQPKAAVTPTPVKAQTPAAPQKSAPAKAQAATAKEQAKPVVAASKPAQEKATVAVEDKKSAVEPKKEPKEYSAAGRRDPFVSPVVNRIATGSGCSSGKRCLAIDQIVLSGIVKSDSGMIAVVVNAMNKAYFLRENDPVFNGYVVRITGDSIIFSETLQDKLGKPFTREVTKKINTPAV